MNTSTKCGKSIAKGYKQQTYALNDYIHIVANNEVFEYIGYRNIRLAQKHWYFVYQPESSNGNGNPWEQRFPTLSREVKLNVTGERSCVIS